MKLQKFTSYAIFQPNVKQHPEIWDVALPPLQCVINVTAAISHSLVKIGFHNQPVSREADEKLRGKYFEEAGSIINDLTLMSVGLGSKLSRELSQIVRCLVKRAVKLW